MERTLKKYAGLKSYFLSEEFDDARFERLHTAFQNPVTEIALLFNQANISLFTDFNKLLQSDEPVICTVHDKVTKLARTLVNRIIKASVVQSTLVNRIIKASVVQNTPVTEIDMADQEIFKPRESVHIGGTTKFNLQRLFNEGDISQEQYDNVFKAAKEYFEASL